MTTTQSTWRILLLSVIFVAGTGTHTWGGTVKVTTPPSLANVEGAGFASPMAVPRRVQFLIPASDFAGLPESHRQIVSFNFRSDSGRTQPFDWSSSDSQIWMSTTPKTALTLASVFDDNHGMDKALVHEGAISFSLLGTGPAQGPRDIAHGPELQTPFNYDPSQGNLLIEWMRFDGGTSSPRIDIQAAAEPGARILLNQTSATAATGTFINDAAVIQFEFAAVPEPSTLALLGLGSAFLVPLRRRQRSHVRADETV